MIRIAMIALFFALAGAGAVHADPLDDALSRSVNSLVGHDISEAEIVRLAAEMRASGVNPADAARLVDIIGEAATDGLPVLPLISKIHEGMAKNVPADRLVSGVSRTHERYHIAYAQAQAAGADGEELDRLGNIIADAYASGMTMEDIDYLMKDVQARRQEKSAVSALATETMEMTRVMSRLGVRSTVVRDIAEDALSKDYGVREIRDMTAAFVGAAETGNPEDVALRFRQAIRNGERLELRQFRQGSGDGLQKRLRRGSGDGQGTGSDSSTPLRLRDGSGGGGFGGGGAGGGTGTGGGTGGGGNGYGGGK